jgi:DNA-binding PadR family transcriptional regulator
MSLKYAMLGFLDMIPMSGYDLKKFFDSSVRFYWTATHSQIYRTLTELEQEGLTTVEVVPQTDVPNKKLYHITDKGREALRVWVGEMPELPPLRHKLLVQLSWADRLTTPEIIIILKGYGHCLQERLALYGTAGQRELAERGRTPRERYLWNALRDNGESVYRAELDWVNRTIEGLEAHP